ncbi:MAG: S-methyl-5'-thioadenosine phosphorylase [Deltaproteobacteria bacterium]|nr:S-methyl-5'-thioadenosine phosphorylase [Nannocystaceae bacterium]
MASPHPASPAARETLVLGVVGGSGLYRMDALQHGRKVEITTPFGAPSGPYTVAELPREGRAALGVVFLARHGAGHVKLPGEVNYRANIHGFKQLGVTHLLSVSAVGSLREEIVPGHLVMPDQFIDRTRGRESTFFGDGAVGHVQFGDPTTPAFRDRARDAARRAGATVHDGGTLVVMEGPAFSTRAESHLYRSWGASIIGMTALPEAKLAREAELAYAVLALATDYDCWHVEEAEVTVEAVMATVARNVELAQRTILELAAALPETTAELPYPRACEHALMTDRELIPVETRARLDLIIGHYLGSHPS